jgi:hypothetical protein
MTGGVTCLQKDKISRFPIIRVKYMFLLLRKQGENVDLKDFAMSFLGPNSLADTRFSP